MAKNNLSIIIPAYKALNFLEENIVFWEKITEVIGKENIYLIEDSEEKQMENFAQKFNWNYHSKMNGNWGSVINYSKSLDIKTKYSCIVDADDELQIDELKKLLSHMETSNADILWTGFTKTDYVDHNNSNNIKKRFWVHSIWFRSSLLKEIPCLPEHFFYTDQHFMMSLENKSNEIEYLEVFPYIHYVNVPGQSTQKVAFNQKNFDSWMNYSNIHNWALSNGFTKRKYLSEQFNRGFENQEILYLKRLFLNSKDNDEKKFLIAKYKERKSQTKLKMFERLIFWKLSALFKFS